MEQHQPLPGTVPLAPHGSSGETNDMYYKEIAKRYPPEYLVAFETSIQEAMAILQDNRLDAILVEDPEGNLSGFVTQDELIQAYRTGLPVHDPVGSIMNRFFELIDENEQVEHTVLSRAPFVVTKNDDNGITGIVSEKILSKQLLRLSVEKIKKEVTTKKLLHQDAETDVEPGDDVPNNLLDLYNRINKLLYVNKELWDIIEYSSDSIYVTDGKGITVYANDSFERMTGAPVSDVIGASVFEIEAKGIYRPSISAIVLREKRQVTLVQRGYNGKDLIVTGTPVFDDAGNIYMVICNSKDIDELSILKNYLSDIKSSSVRVEDAPNKNSKIIYTSEHMMGLMKMVNRVTHVDSTVLLTGESGTGKGMIARYIHGNSARANKKLIEINCSAIPESLFESELFGYESGAFTGAKEGGKPGLIEMANQGTLFLDEIGDMPMHMQVKLLKVLQDRQVTRVGSVNPTNIDIRIIGATNRDLKQLVGKELFRADLYYRLNVFPLHIAPLRERKEDIHILLQHYLTYYNQVHNGNVTLTYRAQEMLSGYSWPGNARELNHYVERLVLIKDGVVDIEHLEMDYDTSKTEAAIIVNKLLPLRKALDETERQLIHIATGITQNSYGVADLLGISQASAYRKIQKHK